MTAITYIAGGSKGLGSQLVKTFENQDHHVIEFSRSGSGNNHINCDFNDIKSTALTLQNTFNTLSLENYDQINLIINTAILAPFGSLPNAESTTIKQHLNINIESSLALLQSFLMAFQHQPSNKTIAYISSGAARRAIPGLAMYSASKAFFERFIDTLAEEQTNEQQPIHCMIINPGVMNTGMQTEIRSQDAKNFPMVGLWNDWHEAGKLANPKDIAEICYRLITNEGKNGGYYTAQDYLINK